MSDTIEREGTGVVAAGGQGSYVLDASALMCLINGEPGSDRVAAVLSSSVMSAVNLAEVTSKLNELGVDADTARALLAPLHLSVVPFDEAAAHTTGALRAAMRGQKLSLGDRACLALSASRRATALTTDKAWAQMGELVDIPVEMLR